MLDRLYSIPEAADALRVSHWAVRKWIREGKMRSSKAGKRRVIRETELQRFVVDDPRTVQPKSR